MTDFYLKDGLNGLYLFSGRDMMGVNSSQYLVLFSLLQIRSARLGLGVESISVTVHP